MVYDFVNLNLLIINVTNLPAMHVYDCQFMLILQISKYFCGHIFAASMALSL